MREKPLFFDMKQGAKPLVVSSEVLEMTDAALERADNARQRELARKSASEAFDAELRKRMSPPGALGLPPLLEERRWQHKLTDATFEHLAMFDKVLLWQFEKEETFGDTRIILSDKGKQRVEQEAPCGMIVSAGLQALDELETNGSALGHVVMFVRLSPWRVPFETVLGKERHLIPLRTCDIIADLDAGRRLQKGELVRARDSRGRNGFSGITPLLPALEDGEV